MASNEYIVCTWKLPKKTSFSGLTVTFGAVLAVGGVSPVDAGSLSREQEVVRAMISASAPKTSGTTRTAALPELHQATSQQLQDGAKCHRLRAAQTIGLWFLPSGSSCNVGLQRISARLGESWREVRRGRGHLTY